MPERPSLAVRALPILTWGLAFHILAMALLFGLFRLPETVVRPIAAWKEVLAALLVVVTVVRVATGRGAGSSVVMADLLAAGWIGLAVLFVVTENTLWANNVPPLAAFLGVRDAALFVLFYFVGRATPEVGEDDRVLRRSFHVLLVASGVAILEQLFVTPQMLVGIGVASYINNFLGTPMGTTGNVYGLPDNYWSMMGGHMVRRSGSIFLSGQGFATPFLVLLPAATMWVWGGSATPSAWRRIGYALVWLGLLVSFTRAAIAACAVQALLAMVYLRRPTGAALVGAVGTAILLGAFVAFPSLATFMFETLTWQTGSSASHLKDWISGVTAFFERPWGYGLGTTDQTAQRAGLDPITYDNLYLKYAVEMGVLGLLALVGTLAAFAAAGARLMRGALTQAQRGLGAAVFLATIGIAIDGMTAAVFNNPIVAYLFFWYAGVAVTLAQRTPRSVPARTTMPLASHA